MDDTVWSALQSLVENPTVKIKHPALPKRPKWGEELLEKQYRQIPVSLDEMEYSQSMRRGIIFDVDPTLDTTRVLEWQSEQEAQQAERIAEHHLQRLLSPRGTFTDTAAGEALVAFCLGEASDIPVGMGSRVVSAAIHHDEARIPGLEGYGARWVGTKAMEIPSLTSADLKYLLSCPGSISYTLAGDGEAVKRLQEHPSFTHELLIPVIAEMREQVQGRVRAHSVFEGDALAQLMARVAGMGLFSWLSPVTGALPREALEALVQAGPSVVSVYEQLEKDAGWMVKAEKRSELAEMAALSVMAL